MEQLLSMITQTELFSGIFCSNGSSKGNCILNRFAKHLRYFKMFDMFDQFSGFSTFWNSYFPCVVFLVIGKLSPVVWNPLKQNSTGALHRWVAK